MAEKNKELEDSVKEIPGLVQKLKEWFSKNQKFADIKVGEKTYKHSGEKFEIGVDVFDGDTPLTDGEYQTETQKFTVKSGKVIDLKPKETPSPVPAVDFSAQIKTVTDAYEAKLAAQKTDFEKQIAEVKAALSSAFDKKVDELVSGTLNKIGDLIKAIESLPSATSQFSKKDGEPATADTDDVWARRMAEAKKSITQKVFKN